MVSVGDEEPAMVVANLRKALAEIDELSAERASIEEALKEERNRDNILPKLMASSGRSDNIFVEEIKKYDELKVGGCRSPPATVFLTITGSCVNSNATTFPLLFVQVNSFLLVALHLIKFYLSNPPSLEGVSQDKRDYDKSKLGSDATTTLLQCRY